MAKRQSKFIIVRKTSKYGNRKFEILSEKIPTFILAQKELKKLIRKVEYCDKGAYKIINAKHEFLKNGKM